MYDTHLPGARRNQRCVLTKWTLLLFSDELRQLRMLARTIEYLESQIQKKFNLIYNEDAERVEHNFPMPGVYSTFTTSGKISEPY